MFGDFIKCHELWYISLSKSFTDHCIGVLNILHRTVPDLKIWLSCKGRQMIEHTKNLVKEKFTTLGGYEHNAEVCPLTFLSVMDLQSFETSLALLCSLIL